MKIPAAVIKETLDPLGKWELRSASDKKAFGYPHLSAGFKNCKGHVVMIMQKDIADTLDAAEDILAVYTAPCTENGLPSCAALIPSEPVPEEKVWERLTGLYDRIDRWNEDLNACGTDMPGIRKMMNIGAAFMKGDLVLIDVSYNIPAYTETGAADMNALIDKESARATEQAIAGLADDPRITAARTLRGVHLYDSDLIAYGAPCSLYRNMFRKGETGYYNRLLFMRLSGRYTQTDRFLLEILSRKIETVTEHLSTFAVPLSGFEALKQLLKRVPEPDYKNDGNILSVLSPLNWKNDDEYRFFIFQSLYTNRDAGITDYLLRSLEKLLPCSCGAEDKGRILLICNITRSNISFSELRSSLADFLRENMYKAGISNTFRSFSLIRGAYLQAEAAASLGNERDPMFWYYLFENYLPDYIIRCASDKMPPEMLILPALERLIRHDKEKGTVYTETLRVLSEENFNTTHAAKRLFIHRSTLQDRIERLYKITALDLEDNTVRALLWFGFHMI